MAKKIQLKTAKNKASVTAFINGILDPEKKKDAKVVLQLMKDITKEKPIMWGDTIVGFGTYEYARANGDVGEFFRMGFSPRKQALTLYIMPGYSNYSELLQKLGPHKIGKSCLYLKNLKNIHVPTLKKLLKLGYADMNKAYPPKK